MNNAPAPESEQAGSGRVMRFVGTCRIAGRHFPSVVCTVSTIYLGLVFAWTSICVALANAEPAPALAPAPTPVAVAAATPGGDEPATIDMQVLAKFA